MATAANVLPDHDASAIVGEIFSSLVIQTTLGAEIAALERAAAHAEAQAEAADRTDEDVVSAAEEAIALAAHERSLRIHAQSKLRCLQSERNADAGRRSLRVPTGDESRQRRRLRLSWTPPPRSPSSNRRWSASG